MIERWRTAVVASALTAALASATPPVTEGEFKLSVIAAYGPSTVTAHGLPTYGVFDGVVAIGHVDRAERRYDGGTLRFVSGKRSLSIHIDKEDHGLWPVRAEFVGEDLEPQVLELHLAGIAPNTARRLRVEWGADRAPRIRFGDHQEVELGARGFVPERAVLFARFGWIAVEPLTIRALGPR